MDVSRLILQQRAASISTGWAIIGWKRIGWIIVELGQAVQMPYGVDNDWNHADEKSDARQYQKGGRAHGAGVQLLQNTRGAAAWSL